MKSIIKKVSTLLLVPILVFSTGTWKVTAAENTVNVQLTVEYGQAEARTVTDMVNGFRKGDQAWYWNEDDTTKTELTGQLDELTYDETLEKIAMKRAAELALAYSHTRANGKDCFTAFAEFGYSGLASGENIAAGYSSAEAVFVGWREDDYFFSGQGHRRNMLDKKFTAIGMGHVYYNGTHYWAMELGTVSSAGDSGTDGTQTVEVETRSSDIQSLSTEESSTIALGSTKVLPEVNATIKSGDTWVQSGNGNPTGTITNPNWTVADPSIASISDGQVTGLAVGTTTLTVTVGNASATTTLEVTSDGQGNDNTDNDGNTGTTPGDNGSSGDGGNNGSDTPGNGSNGSDNTGSGSDNTGNGGSGPDNTGNGSNGSDNTGSGSDNTSNGSDNTGNGSSGSDNTGNGSSGSDNTGNSGSGSDNTGNGSSGSDNTGNSGNGSDNTGNGGNGSDNTGNGGNGSDNTGNGGSGSDNTDTGNIGSGNGTASGNKPSNDNNSNNNNNNNNSGNNDNGSNDGSSSNDGQDTSSIIANATPSIVIPVTSVVNSVKTSSEGIYLATSCNGTIVSTPAADISRGYDLTSNEKPYSKFYNFDAKKSPLAKNTIDSAADSLKATVGPILNIELGKMSGGKYSLLSSDGETIRLVLGIPKTFAQSDKTFAVIRVREGGISTVLKDLDTNPDTVTFDTTGGAGVYAIVKY